MACFYFSCRYYGNLCTWWCQSCEPLRFLNGFQAIPFTQWGILCRFVLGLKGSLLHLQCVSVYADVCAPLLSCKPWTESGTGFSGCLKESVFVRWKNLPFKFLCSLYQDYNSHPGLNTKGPCYSFPQIFWKAKSEARENTGLNPVLLEPKINGIYMKVGFGLLHLSFKAID